MDTAELGKRCAGFWLSLADWPRNAKNTDAGGYKVTDFAKMTLEELLCPEGHACACGRLHTTGLRRLYLGKGTIASLPDALLAAKSKRPFIVSDENTDIAAGEQVRMILEKHQIPYVEYVFPKHDGHLEPDEYAVGALCMAFDPNCDSVLAVGSGVINDCCKVLAHAVKVPSLVVATAPSMDGYASDSASMIQNRMKITLYNACPVAVIADTDILKKAPEQMMKAGLGDMLAKYISICEWRISHIVTGEYYCENIAGLMRASLSKIRKHASGLLRREEDALENVMEGLVLSGVAMSFAKISRPASGLEHYFSHLWEMKALREGRCSALHGIQVGVGTCLTLNLCDHVRAMKPDAEKAKTAVAHFSSEAWEAEMRAIFGEKTAEDVIALESHLQKNTPRNHEKRLAKILLHWDEIQQVIHDELPPKNVIVDLMKELQMVTTPQELGLTQQDAREAFFGSREIRDKYLTSSLLWDLGALHDFAQYL